MHLRRLMCIGHGRSNRRHYTSLKDTASLVGQVLEGKNRNDFSWLVVFPPPQKSVCVSVCTCLTGRVSIPLANPLGSFDTGLCSGSRMHPKDN